LKRNYIFGSNPAANFEGLELFNKLKKNNMSIVKVIKQITPQVLLSLYRKQKEKGTIIQWVKKDCPSPPPHIIKQIAIKESQKKYKYSILVETGTNHGDMVYAQLENFKKIFSIELGEELHKNACKRFINNKNVTIVLGDSSKMLPVILKDINEPVIFWLDGHYDGGENPKGDKECPIYEELDAIFNAKQFNHVLLIDDARLFVGRGDFPLLEKLVEYVKTKNAAYKVEVKNDIIRFYI
jgi:hypothetical protein